ncbi:MAG: addiction module protein [Desulfatiglans sp.]|mgnify:CR=1 FL=1|jgi:putative addiction module component (TIGR02574 family)|nr:addiction module protein [Desulfatiglans sp.]
MVTKILDEALKIPTNERVALAELILASIDYEEEPVREAWIAEVKDRMSAVQDDKSRLLDFHVLYK